MLPPLPSFLPARPTDIQAPDLTIYPDSQITSTPGAGPSTCSICSSTPKYTCPRCSSRTCSLDCSRTHKSQTGCSGVRDPAKFVTLSEFGQGDWGGDYAYLESGRRKIADWGKDLPASVQGGNDRGRHSRQTHSQSQHQGRKRGPPKLEGLRRELEKRGIEVEFMPEGMGRRKMNQSTWNPKTQKLHMTIQLSIPESLLHVPGLDSESAPGAGNKPNGTGTKTINHLRALFSETTLQSLLPPSLPSEVVLLLPFHPSVDNPTPIDVLLRQSRPRLFFPPLDPLVPLERAFKGMSWVEYPVIQVMGRAEWEAMEREGRVAVVPVAIRGQERGMKRGAEEIDADMEEEKDKKARPAQAVPAVGGSTGGGGLMALGGYESDEDQDQQETLEEDEVDTGEEMIVTEEDVRVLHALGAAAAADMA